MILPDTSLTNKLRNLLCWNELLGEVDGWILFPPVRLLVSQDYPSILRNKIPNFSKRQTVWFFLFLFFYQNAKKTKQKTVVSTPAHTDRMMGHRPCSETVDQAAIVPPLAPVPPTASTAAPR